jgi:hypothetical protein
MSCLSGRSGVSRLPRIWNARERLIGIVVGHPGVKLPEDLLAEIDALEESDSPQSTVLRIVDKMMETGWWSSEGGAVPRERVSFGLNLINCFLLEACSAPQDLIGELIEDLMELDAGVVSPVLQPASIANRPPDSRMRKAQKALAAAMCEQLMLDGAPRELAGDQVAKVLNKHKMSLQVGDVEGKTVLQWRRTLCCTDDFRQWLLGHPDSDLRLTLSEFESFVKGWLIDSRG